MQLILRQSAKAVNTDILPFLFIKWLRNLNVEYLSWRKKKNNKQVLSILTLHKTNLLQPVLYLGCHLTKTTVTKT